MEEILHRLCYNIKDENPETCKQLAQKLLLEPMLKANLMDLQQPIKVLNYNMLSYVTLEIVDDIAFCVFRHTLFALLMKFEIDSMFAFKIAIWNEQNTQKEADVGPYLKTCFEVFVPSVKP